MAYKQQGPIKDWFASRKAEKQTEKAMGLVPAKKLPSERAGNKLALGLEKFGTNIQKSKWGQKHPGAAKGFKNFLTGQQTNVQKQYTPRQKMRQAVRDARQKEREKEGSLIGSEWYGYGGTKQKLKRSKNFGRQKGGIQIFQNNKSGGPGTGCDGACFAKY